MKKNFSNYNLMHDVILLLLSVIGFACQKVIDVDLNSAAPQIVIEGNISDSPGPYYVTLSKTVNFDQPNTFPPVTDANVVISDTVGNSELLTETSPGTYRTSVIQGTPGRTYTLDVTAEGKEYIATSTMPAPVKFDSLTLDYIVNGPDRSWAFKVDFKDPAGVKNYYHFVLMRNSIISQRFFLYDDRIQDGESITYDLVPDTLRYKDTVVIFLQCIDKGVYDYFRTASQISNGRGSQSASPANPLSNFNNGALGYFSAYAARSKRMVIQ
jgi:hypothetical protein